MKKIMSTIDCSNIYNFKSEWERRNRYFDKHNIPHYDKQSFTLELISEDYISKLQKWSDEHPRITRKEKFKKMCEENGFENVTLCLNNNVPSLNCRGSNCVDCFEYWNEEVDG